MHPRAVAEQTAHATTQTRRAAAVIGAHFGIDAGPLTVTHSPGGPEVRVLRERQAVAAFLEQVATAIADGSGTADVLAAPRRKASEPDATPR